MGDLLLAGCLQMAGLLAVLAFLLNEAETEAFAKAIAADPKRLISAFNLLEAAIVIEAKKGEAGGIELDLLLHRARIETVAISAEQVELARTACDYTEKETIRLA